jgi:RNA 3'-terminal phosphate cyclase
VRYLPGQLVGGAGLEHDCAPSRGLAYYMEPLVCLALFAKKVRRGVEGGCASRRTPSPDRLPTAHSR